VVLTNPGSEPASAVFPVTLDQATEEAVTDVNPLPSPTNLVACNSPADGLIYILLLRFAEVVIDAEVSEV